MCLHLLPSSPLSSPLAFIPSHSYHDLLYPLFPLSCFPPRLLTYSPFSSSLSRAFLSITSRSHPLHILILPFPLHSLITSRSHSPHLLTPFPLPFYHFPQLLNPSSSSFTPSLPHRLSLTFSPLPPSFSPLHSLITSPSLSLTFSPLPPLPSLPYLLTPSPSSFHSLTCSPVTPPPQVI